jgi:hypothetical protein
MHLLELGDRVSLDSLPKVQVSIQPTTAHKKGDGNKSKNKLQIISESKSLGTRHSDVDNPAARVKTAYSANNLNGTSESLNNRSSTASGIKKTSTQMSCNEISDEDKRTNNRTESLPPGTALCDSESSRSNGGDYANDPAEFVELIKDYLFADRIHLAVNRIRSALDREKIDLNRRLNQLESFMESDCEVIVTNRSSSRSTSSKSTPRSNSFMIGESHDAVDCSGIYLECEGCGVSFPLSDQENVSTAKHALVAGQKGMQIDRSKVRGHSVELEVLCIGCRVRIRDRDSNESKPNHLERGFDSSVKISPSTTIHRIGSSSSSKALGMSSAGSEKSSVTHHQPSSRLTGHSPARTADPDSISPTHRSVSADAGADTAALSEPIEDSQPRFSKFRNKLQAARDEHHFLADDYSLR